MSETAPPAELYDLAFAALPDWIEPAKRQTMALDMLDALRPHLDARRGIGGNFPPEETADAPQSEEERLLAIDPEHLVVVETAELGPLFDLHYRDLKQRGADLLAECQDWQDAHRTPKGGIVPVKDDAENGDLADRIVKMDTFSREAEEARKKVKLAVYNAGLAVDGWFKGGLVDPVMAIRGVAAKVGNRSYPPGPETMAGAQTAYVVEKAERERKERERIAKEAQEEANRKAIAARQAAEQEAARAAALERSGLAPEDAQALAEVATDRAAEAADSAQQNSALIGSYATETPREVVRQHTASGTTIGLRETWGFNENSVDMVALCKGVVDGTVPTTFVTVIPQAINQAIRARINPLRQCPGLIIAPVASAARRGAR
jgi:hypothetical protein